MWPWDGNQGSPVTAGGFPTPSTTDDRPGPQLPAAPRFSKAPYPASPTRNLAPAAEGKLETGDPARSFPRNRHMIDYEGRTNTRHGYGFCYDDVPFGRGENAVPRSPGVLFKVEVVSSQTLGDPFQVTVTAIDAEGNTVTDYVGTVLLDIEDATPGADSPVNSGVHINSTAERSDDVHTFAASDGGVHVFSVTAHTAELIGRFRAYNLQGGLPGFSNSVNVDP